MTANDIGDLEDFGDFVRATGTQLYRQALLLTGDHHLAEDLTQTTYARVYASWRRVSRAENPVAYARTTLLNAFLYWEDRSVADTARDLGLTETAVRTRSRRALQRLRPLLGADLTERTP